MKKWLEHRISRLNIAHLGNQEMWKRTRDKFYLERTIQVGSQLTAYKQVLDYLKSHESNN